MKTDRKDMTTTRYSTTIAQLRIIPTYYNMPILTIALLQYKWLKPQYQAKYYHTYQQVIKTLEMPSCNGKQTITAIRPKNTPQFFRRYYNMDNIKINFKKTICESLLRNNCNKFTEFILIHHTLNKKHLKNNGLSLYKQKISSNLTQKSIKNMSQIQSPTAKKEDNIKNTHKSPPLSKHREEDPNQKNNNIQQGKTDSKRMSKQEDYGLIHYNSKKLKDKVGLEEKKKQKDKKKSKQQLTINQNIMSSQQNQYYGNDYQNIQNDLRFKSMTPRKSIKTFRKVLSKQSFDFKSCKMKTDRSEEKQKNQLGKK